MPIYVYKCTTCHESYDCLQSNFTPPETISCQNCGGLAARVMSLSASVRTKGDPMDRLEGVDTQILSGGVLETKRYNSPIQI